METSRGEAAAVSASGKTAAVPAGSEPAALEAAPASPVTAAAGMPPAAADPLSAMLATAIPGTSFVDPLGGGQPGAEASGMPQDSDPTSANGTEA
jgi:hypothetical protein